MNGIFIISLGLFLYLLLTWGFRHLPDEKWQMIGAIPEKKADENGIYKGISLTYYGFFQSNSYMVAILLCISLLGAINVSLSAVLFILISVLAICIPAASLVARIVEKKAHTLTIGGASFVGIIIAPPVCLISSLISKCFFGTPMDVLPVLAALAVAYTIGEGVGRLSCISFGCCYGKPLSTSPQWIQRLFKKHYFVFTGKNKKISYADQLDGERVVPIQAVTAVIYCSAALLGTWLFLYRYYYITLVSMILITQIWRFISEFFRADYRGNGKISAYQIMGIIACIYTMIIPYFIPQGAEVVPDILTGIKRIWDPLIILLLQGIWIGIFLHTGRSHVTGATMRFFVHEDRI